MKIRSTKPKGQRIYKSTHKFRPLWIEPIESNYWFNLTTGEWEYKINNFSNCTSSYYSMESEGYKNIWSIKAAKRAIFNWNVPKGTVFRVSLPWVGHEFFITKP